MMPNELIKKTKDFFKNVYSKVIKFLFLKYIKNIRLTPPISNFNDHSDLIVLSMVQKNDVDMLLIAIKSFVRFVEVKKIVIVADPTLDVDDMSLIRKHLVKVEFILSKDMDYTDAPRGGCWERLISIADINNQGYVIQLDADTITLKEPKQVLEAYDSNLSFTLGTKMGQKVVTCETASTLAKEFCAKGIDHIQVVSEAMLNELPSKYQNYVRGCAGFAGFAKNAINRNQVFELSKIYYESIGNKWNDWGSEQFASNLLIANCDNSIVLDLEKYDVPKKGNNSLCFHHYIGTIRFSSLLYFNNAKKIINELF